MLGILYCILTLPVLGSIALRCQYPRSKANFSSAGQFGEINSILCLLLVYKTLIRSRPTIFKLNCECYVGSKYQVMSLDQDAFSLLSNCYKVNVVVLYRIFCQKQSVRYFAISKPLLSACFHCKTETLYIWWV